MALVSDTSADFNWNFISPFWRYVWNYHSQKRGYVPTDERRRSGAVLPTGQTSGCRGCHCQQYVGRIVAKGGDSVEITEQATVKVNESVVLEQNIFYQTPQYESDVTYPLQLQDQQYFVLGDHREGATDSRYLGAVDTREIKGKIITVIRRNQL